VVRTSVIALLAAVACLAPVSAAAAAPCPAPAAKTTVTKAKKTPKKAKKARPVPKKAKRKAKKKVRASAVKTVRCGEAPRASEPVAAPAPVPAPTAKASASAPHPAPTPVAAPLPPAPQAPDPLLAARPFAPTSFWNTPLTEDAELDARSDDYVGELQRQLTQWVPYLNTTKYSSPVYEVPADQPTVHVTLDQYNPKLSAALAQVPIPPDAQAAEGTDAHLAVWQPSTDTMWELWRAAKRADGWHAAYGGRMTGVSKNPGYFSDPPWGATATSLPLAGGLIRLSELRAGRIDHALALAIPERLAKVYSWPAQRTDGISTSPNAIPSGLRFRIDPRLDLNRIAMAPIVREIATAVQRYGMVVRDGAGAVTFYAEDPTPTGTNPFIGSTGFFGGKYINQLLTAFPWSHLQALRTDLKTQP
jgi:hypothetical protein